MQIQFTVIQRLEKIYILQVNTLIKKIYSCHSIIFII